MEPPQQSLSSTLHSLSSGGDKVAAHRFHQAVEVDIGVAKVDVAEDACQRHRRQGPRLGLGRRAKAVRGIFKRTDQEGKQLGRAVFFASQRVL